MTELYTEHLDLSDGIKHSRFLDFKSRNMQPEYQDDLRRVHSENKDLDYLLGKVSVLEVPFEDADVTADRVEVWLCSCPDFHFNRSDGVETGERTPSEMGKCKHLKRELREERARSDDQQDTIV